MLKNLKPITHSIKRCKCWLLGLFNKMSENGKKKSNHNLFSRFRVALFKIILQRYLNLERGLKEKIINRIRHRYVDH